MAQFFSSENDLYFMSSSGKVKAFPQASILYVQVCLHTQISLGLHTCT